MADAQRRLTELLSEGLTVYPPNMRGLAAPPARVPRRGVARGPIKPDAARKFLSWVKMRHPRLYAAAQQRANASTALGQVEAPAAQSPLDRILSTVTALAPQYLQLRAQKDLYDLQLDRLRQGLAPVDPRMFAPALDVQVSVSPEQAAAAAAAAAEKAKPWLLYGGLAVGAFLLLRTFGRRR